MPSIEDYAKAATAPSDGWKSQYFWTTFPDPSAGNWIIFYESRGTRQHLQQQQLLPLCALVKNKEYDALYFKL